MARNKQSVVFLDTHITVWLYAGLIGKISKKAQQAIDTHEILISPIVKLELQYLFEIGRIKVKPYTIIRSLSQSIGLRVSETPLIQIIETALRLNWTRDVFDRLLSAEAKLESAGFISADNTIKSHFKNVIW